MTLDSTHAAAIAGSVADGFAEQVAHTQDLVRFASLRGEEHAIQDFVFRQWRRRGYEVDRFAMDHAAIAAHPGGSSITAAHSAAPKVRVASIWPRPRRCRS